MINKGKEIVNCLLDSGSNVNLIPKDFIPIDAEVLDAPEGFYVLAYDKTERWIDQYCYLDIHLKDIFEKDESKKVQFYVTNEGLSD